MVVRVRDEGGNRFVAFGQRLAAEVAARTAGTGVDAHVTGTPFVAYRGINAVTTDLRNSLIAAFVVIALIIAVLFRSVRVALLCLIPNAAPLLVGYGMMGALGWVLDPTPAVVFTVALGIAVDDTIHLTVRFREEQRQGRSLEEAIRQAVLHTGRAVTVTSVILCAGFGGNTLSALPTMAILGYLGATVIAVALLCDLFLLPALLILFDRPLFSPQSDDRGRCRSASARSTRVRH